MPRKNKLTRSQLIFFHGEENSGKSTTLTELGRMLLPECEQYSEERLTTTSKGEKRILPDCNISCKWHGIQILICTMGDHYSDVRKNVARFLSQKFDIAITASRWMCNSCYTKSCPKPKALATCDEHDIPIRKIPAGGRRADACYTTSKELYMHILHLYTTGSFL